MWVLLQMRIERYVGSTPVRKSSLSKRYVGPSFTRKICMVYVGLSLVRKVCRSNSRAKPCRPSWLSGQLGVLGCKGSQDCAWFRALQARGGPSGRRTCLGVSVGSAVAGYRGVGHGVQGQLGVSLSAWCQPCLHPKLCGAGIGNDVRQQCKLWKEAWDERIKFW